MSHQYFDNVENLKSDVKEIDFYYYGSKLRFRTDSGVFSKTYIDYGSQVLLKAVDFPVESKSLLDVGCGYGAIGISLASRYPNIRVDMIDVNLRAIELAKQNIQLNQLNNAHVSQSDVYQSITSTYDVIVTNPPIRAGKQVVHAIFVGSKDHLNMGGVIFVVIQKKQGAPSALKKLEEVFGNVEIIVKDSGYYILKSTKKEI
ncbi:MAG TPA: class I SAM-dependent methyltransferase [Bacilli bacterium]|nr:class I SAM-dependent methyltransferase [Bacilli bacterium]